MRLISIVLIMFAAGEAGAAPLASLRLIEQNNSVTYRLLPGKTKQEAFLERTSGRKTKRTRILAGLSRKIQSDLTDLSWQIKYAKQPKLASCKPTATIDVGVHEHATACAESAGQLASVRHMATKLNRLM